MAAAPQQVLLEQCGGEKEPRKCKENVCNDSHRSAPQPSRASGLTCLPTPRHRHACTARRAVRTSPACSGPCIYPKHQGLSILCAFRLSSSAAQGATTCRANRGDVCDADDGESHANASKFGEHLHQRILARHRASRERITPLGSNTCDRFALLACVMFNSARRKPAYREPRGVGRCESNACE